ncbi:MAG: tetratricopeptide repeat protein [Candidatus Gribaldobacteria bacterium]|nr:tetratricopeptide repeat protein [Candidatus Gribaldobacteria bacterium]
MENIFKQNSVKVVAVVILIIAGFLIYSHSSKNSPAPKGPQALAIENKGLAEFNAENDTINTVSTQDKKLAEEMMSIFKEMGDGKDNAKNKEAVVALDKIIGKYKEYSDAYLLRATISVLVGDTDYQKILSDIDNAIKFHSSTKYSSAYDSTGGMYSLRAKVDILSNNYQQAINDLETAVKVDPTKMGDVFNTGGVKAEDDSNPTALQKKDIDLLIAKYPNDYRVYMFKGLFYNSFTTYDEQYYNPTIDSLKQAQKINPSSALVSYFLGTVYEKEAFWSKAAASDISDIAGASGGYKVKTNGIALQYFHEAVTLDPKFAEAYYQAASSLYNLKGYAEAIPFYDRAIELDPNNFGALNDRALAKTYTNDYYGAISDYSQAINLKKTKANSSLDNTYENRASAYVKTTNYESAIEDYSRAIGLKFASTVFIMSLPQIRAIYPELSDISDKDLLEGLRQKYLPNMSSADFVGNYKDNSKKIGCDFVFATLYSNRADVYISKGDFKGATREYTRATHCDEKYTSTLDRWKTISKTSDTEYLVDSQTIDFSQGNVVFLWAEILNTNDKSYSKSNFQINCSEKKIKSLSATNYNSVGNITGNIPAQDWQSVIPETIGEVLYNGMCK